MLFRSQGLFGAVFGLSSIVGPFAGGFLTDTVGWHWIFYVNLPIGIASLFVLGRLLPTIKRPDATRNLDFLGAGVFIVAISALLIGLTNKQTADWATPEVGGLISVGLLLGAVFLLVESRAKEPIIPLGLFRNRTYASSIVSTFLVSFGFFGAIVFLPRWFQFVQGFSPTNSGLAALPLMVGLISSSIASGLLVARTGRYKWLVVGAIVVMGISTALMTQLRADTSLPVVWSWMFIAGLGVGPTFAVFTIIVQNAVPFHELGVATSNLTFFRQIGGTVALAIVGTIFGSEFERQFGPQLAVAGVPAPVVDGFNQAAGSGALDFNKLTGVGDLGTSILASVPSQVRPVIEPFISNIVFGIHQAFSLGVASTFWIGVGAAAIGALAAAAMHEIPLRRHLGAAPSVERSTTGQSPTVPAAD